MSDPTNPYGGTSPSTEIVYGAQPTYGGQGAYGTQPGYGAGQNAYGGGQAGYGGGPAYGPQASYGQPVYGQGVYMLNPAVERLRSNATMVRIMAFVSFVTLGPLLAIPAWFWGGSLVSEAQSMGAPADVIADIRGARSAAMICSVIEIVGLVVFVVIFFIIPFIALFAIGAGY
ncbi:hypothetical protein [uncultured Actinomyces sp.]|uniref:hypothetical protein n=1 Tax=uncultured Actinomyces sp. TaxID=249061 RepID=UPI002620B85A|nr:hypothetical protein [uncultured Actinomyces sp.]